MHTGIFIICISADYQPAQALEYWTKLVLNRIVGKDTYQVS